MALLRISNSLIEPLATLAQAYDQLAAEGQPLGERLAELSHLLTMGSVKPFKGFTNLHCCLRSPLRLPRSQSTLRNHG